MRPAADHSFGNRSGAFMVASSGAGQARDEAALLSDEIPRTSPQCNFELWYQMLGVRLLIALPTLSAPPYYRMILTSISVRYI